MSSGSLFLLPPSAFSEEWDQLLSEVHTASAVEAYEDHSDFSLSATSVDDVKCVEELII